jgi:hypothetical protein
MLVPILGVALGASSAEAWFLLPAEDYVRFPGLLSASDDMQSLEDLLDLDLRKEKNIAPATLSTRLAWSHELLRALRFILTYRAHCGDVKTANVMISSCVPSRRTTIPDGGIAELTNQSD